MSRRIRRCTRRTRWCTRRKESGRAAFKGTTEACDAIRSSDSPDMESLHEGRAGRGRNAKDGKGARDGLIHNTSSTDEEDVNVGREVEGRARREHGRDERREKGRVKQGDGVQGWQGLWQSRRERSRGGEGAVDMPALGKEQTDEVGVL